MTMAMELANDKIYPHPFLCFPLFRVLIIAELFPHRALGPSGLQRLVLVCCLHESC